mmetsp:Transcript_385/g.909  ORF Transcript_385/g.909 Transcript_385/m.909 type:complete len:99 (+) Transcript_385:3367-3663(+)
MPSYALAVALGSKMSLRSFKSNQEDTLNIDVYRQLGFEIKVLARQKHLSKAPSFAMPNSALVPPFFKYWTQRQPRCEWVIDGRQLQHSTEHQRRERLA